MPRPVAYPFIARAYDTTYCTASEQFNLQLNSQAEITDRNPGDSKCPNFEVRYEKYGATLYVQCWHTTDKTLTPFHFFVGDNSRNLAYGVVVADNAYNPDSIAPVYDYILDDILHLLNNWTTYKTR